MRMFKCTVCKGSFHGEPAMTNNCGPFCDTCKRKLQEKMKMTVLKKQESWDGSCIYCGQFITESKPSPDMKIGGGGKHLHYECALKRDWMLRCIRHSDRLAKYVAKTETSEKPLREAREKAKLEAVNPDLSQAKKKPANDDRIDRLEKMIEKLTAALGGIE